MSPRQLNIACAWNFLKKGPLARQQRGPWVYIHVIGFCFLVNRGDCMISKSLLKEIDSVNKVGSYIGVVVPNGFEMNPLLQSSSFVTSEKRPYVDISGRRFRIGTIENQRVIVVMTGLSMLNA
ncbi:bark storage protein A, partial [Tanacetum coccineum]